MTSPTSSQTSGGSAAERITVVDGEINTVANLKPIVRESISVRTFYEKVRDILCLSIPAGIGGLDNLILEKSLNRPSFALTGFYDCFAGKRLQLLGAGEFAYIDEMSPATQSRRFKAIIDYHVPAFLLGNNCPPPERLLVACERHNVPLLVSARPSSEVSTEATIQLEKLFAPSVFIHATLVDVRGIGVLIRGKSGVGKSECALALIERGHSLVADDLVKIDLRGDKELVGTYKASQPHGFMECRGVGVIDVRKLYGIRSVLPKKRINMVVSLADWTPDVEEERTGAARPTYEILGQRVPHFKLYVRPGRDMARLVEVAALLLALRRDGYDCFEEFNRALIECNIASAAAAAATSDMPAPAPVRTPAPVEVSSKPERKPKRVKP